MFNPFKYQYMATLIKYDGEIALVRLQAGANDQEIQIPKSILPKELTPGQNFTLNFQHAETAQQGETEALKFLLQELIR